MRGGGRRRSGCEEGAVMGCRREEKSGERRRGEKMKGNDVELFNKKNEK